MHTAKKWARKIGVLLVGIPVLLLGLILIPLPGPGILVCLAGLFILSLEFEFAKKYLDICKNKFQAVMDKAKAKNATVKQEETDKL